jgi:hypothetical protein
MSGTPEPDEFSVPWNENPSITEDTPRLAPNPYLNVPLRNVHLLGAYLRQFNATSRRSTR